MARDGFIEVDPSPGTSSRQIIGPSYGRRTLTFFPPSIGRVTLSNIPVTADGAGLVLTAGQAPLRLTFDEDEMAITKAWHALYTSGATGVSWIQGMV